MRMQLLAAVVAAAPLAWCGTARAQILAEGHLSISGWRSGEPATGVEFIVSFDDHQSWTDDPVLFDHLIWTPDDVGRVVSIGSFLDDPDYPAASATLIDGVDGYVSVSASIQPGGGGPGVGQLEASLFQDAIHVGPDFAGAMVDAIALRLDALTLDDPQSGAVNLELTLLVLGSADWSSVSPELAQCTADLEETRESESACMFAYWEVAAELGGLRDGLAACQSDLTALSADASRLGAQLALAQADLATAQAELGAAQASLAEAQTALAAALDDADADGVRDPGDSCLGSEPATAIDGVGCSLAQFCTAIDASTGSGRAICNRSDWRNDEPLADSPNDCKASAGRCEAR